MKRNYVFITRIVGVILVVIVLLLIAYTCGVSKGKRYNRETTEPIIKYTCKYTPGIYKSEDGNYTMVIDKHRNCGYKDERHAHDITLLAQFNYQKSIEQYSYTIYPYPYDVSIDSYNAYFLIQDGYIEVIDANINHREINCSGKYYLISEEVDELKTVSGNDVNP